MARNLRLRTRSACLQALQCVRFARTSHRLEQLSMRHLAVPTLRGCRRGHPRLSPPSNPSSHVQLFYRSRLAPYHRHHPMERYTLVAFAAQVLFATCTHMYTLARITSCKTWIERRTSDGKQSVWQPIPVNLLMHLTSTPPCRRGQVRSNGDGPVKGT